MKSTAKVITAAIFVLCSYISYSQLGFNPDDPKQRLKVQKNAMSHSAFIFEGRSTYQKTYRATRGYILTCTTIQITKIFKGNPQIKLGSIKIITEQGGGIEGEDTPIIEPSEIGAYISNEQTCIIFADIVDTSLLGTANSPAKTITTDNSPILFAGDIIRYDFKEHDKTPKISPLANWWGAKFNSLEELYAYLKDNGGLIIQAEAVKPKQLISPADSTKQKKMK